MFFDVRVLITFQSAVSASDDASEIRLSQMLFRSFLFNAVSKDSVDETMPSSTANVEMRTIERLGPSDALALKLTTFPPKPNEAPHGRCNHFGAFFSVKVGPCGCVWALLKKSSSSTVCD